MAQFFPNGWVPEANCFNKMHFIVLLSLEGRYYKPCPAQRGWRMRKGGLPSTWSNAGQGLGQPQAGGRQPEQGFFSKELFKCYFLLVPKWKGLGSLLTIERTEKEEAFQDAPLFQKKSNLK